MPNVIISLISQFTGSIYDDSIYQFLSKTIQIINDLTQLFTKVLDICTETNDAVLFLEKNTEHSVNNELESYKSELTKSKEVLNKYIQKMSYSYLCLYNKPYENAKPTEKNVILSGIVNELENKIKITLSKIYYINKYNKDINNSNKLLLELETIYNQNNKLSELKYIPELMIIKVFTPYYKQFSDDNNLPFDTSDPYDLITKCNEHHRMSIVQTLKDAHGSSDLYKSNNISNILHLKSNNLSFFNIFYMYDDNINSIVFKYNLHERDCRIIYK